MSKPEEAFDPYHKWLGIPAKEQPANYYRLLGVSLFESNADVISNAVDRIMAHIRGFQTGKRARAAQQILTEISLAKVVLLNPTKKAAYDAELRAAAEGDDPLSGSLPEAISVDSVVQPSPTPFTEFGEAESETVTSRAKGGSRTSTSAAGMGMVGLAIAVLLLMGGIVAAFVLAPSLFEAADDPIVVAEDIDPNNTDDGNPTTDDAPNSLDPTDGADPTTDTSEITTDSSEGDGATPIEPSTPTDGEESVDLVPPETTDPEPPTTTVPSPNLTPLPGSEDASEPPPTVETTRKASVPALVDRQSQRKRITDLFSIDEATTVKTQLALAKQILDAAALSTENQPEHFVLLNIARELACQAGDPTLAFTVIAELEQAFEINADQVKVLSIRELITAQAPVESKKSVLPLGIELVHDLLSRHEYIKAEALITELQSISRRLQVRDNLPELAELKKVIMPFAEQQTRANAALKVLENNADDPDANQAAGEYLAFVRQDFASALPLLAKSSDEALRNLAEQEQTVPADAEEQEKLASAWWDAAEMAPAMYRDDYKLRAGYWYEQAAPSLSVLLANRANQRLEEIAETISDDRITIAKPKGVARIPSSIEGFALIAVDDLAEVRVNGEHLGNAKWPGETKVPVTLKIGDVITVRLADEGTDLGFRMIFTNEKRTHAFYTNRQTWYAYTPNDASQWWTVTPDRFHRPADPKFRGMKLRYSKSIYARGLGAAIIWGDKKSQSFVYHVVNEADFEELTEIDYPIARRSGRKVKGTLHVSGSDYFDLVINGVPTTGGTKEFLKSENVELQVGDVITAKVKNMYEESRGLQLVFLSDDQKVAFGTNHNTWFEYRPTESQRWWKIAPAQRYPNAVATTGQKMPLDDRPELTANVQPPVERVFRSDGGKWGTTCLFHVVTKDDLKPR